MNRIHVYSPPATMGDDPRLVELFLEAERNRGKSLLHFFGKVAVAVGLTVAAGWGCGWILARFL